MDIAEANNTDPYFLGERSYFEKNLMKVIQRGALFKVILMNNEIVAWGCAVIGAPYLHTREQEVSQMYYQTKLKGFSAVKALRLYHKSMIEYAEKNGIEKCVSTSIMDTQETFYRILEKDGWVRRGCTMVYKLPKKNPTGPRLALVRIPGRQERLSGKQNASASPRG
jgi:hypothetical protein